MTHVEFLSGMIAAGCVACCLFFFRFWTRTRDGLFRSFALTFLLLGISQALITLTGPTSEDQSYIYLIRFAAFCILTVDILRKNLAR